MGDIGDEFRVVLVAAIRALCLKFPAKHRALMGFLASALREDGGLEYKRAIVDAIVSLVRAIPDAREPGLGHLCEFIEDCEFTSLSTAVLHLLGAEGPATRDPERYVRHIYNRVILENAAVRAAAVSSLAAFARSLPRLQAPRGRDPAARPGGRGRRGEGQGGAGARRARGDQRGSGRSGRSGRRSKGGGREDRRRRRRAADDAAAAAPPRRGPPRPRGGPHRLPGRGCLRALRPGLGAGGRPAAAARGGRRLLAAVVERGGAGGGGGEVPSAPRATPRPPPPAESTPPPPPQLRPSPPCPPWPTSALRRPPRRRSGLRRRRPSTASR